MATTSLRLWRLFGIREYRVAKSANFQKSNQQHSNSSSPDEDANPVSFVDLTHRRFVPAGFGERRMLRNLSEKRDQPDSGDEQAGSNDVPMNFGIPKIPDSKNCENELGDHDWPDDP